MVKRPIHYKSIMEVYRVLRDLKSKNGFWLSVEEYKDVKIKEKKMIKIKFYEKKRLVSMLQEFGVVGVADSMVRKLTGGRKAEVVCSKERPFIFNYLHTRGKLSITFYYNVVNRCGVVM